MRVLVLAVVLASSTATADLYPKRSTRVLELGVHEGVPWPIINAPIDGPLPPAPTSELPPPAPGSRAAAKVMTIIDELQTKIVSSRYQAATYIVAKDGIYDWDCSGMAAWILRKAAPVALKTIDSKRPVASQFAETIMRAPTKRPRNGWQRIDRVADVLPGDVFAWRRPRGIPSQNTGHVGFVVGAPLPVPGIPNAWAVPIADSTRGRHQNDTRVGDDDGGFGIGTLVFLTDEDGRATSYGWSGTQSEWYTVTPVQFGRVHR